MINTYHGLIVHANESLIRKSVETGEKDHEKENEKYACDIAFLGSSTTSAAIFDIKTQTPTLCGVYL